MCEVCTSHIFSKRASRVAVLCRPHVDELAAVATRELPMLLSLRRISRFAKPRKRPYPCFRTCRLDLLTLRTLHIESQSKPLPDTLAQLESSSGKSQTFSATIAQPENGNQDDPDNAVPERPSSSETPRKSLRGGSPLARQVLREKTFTRRAQCPPPQPEEQGTILGTSLPSDEQASFCGPAIFPAQKWERAGAAQGTQFLNRHVLITGGTGGIGLATAKRCVAEGASSVAIMGRSASRLKAAMDMVWEQSGMRDAPIWAIQADLRDFVGLKSILESDEDKRWQQWNTLINCAGQAQSKLLASTSDEELSSILSTNLEGSIRMSRFIQNLWSTSHRKNRTSGQWTTGPSFCIVNVSSLLAVKGGTGASVYAASKAGLLAFSRAYALEISELAKRVKNAPPFRVNTVLPGYIETPMLDDFRDEFRNKLMAEIPLGRFGTPEEVADAVTFLVSNEYANNCVLNLDGGLSAT